MKYNYRAGGLAYDINSSSLIDKIKVLYPELKVKYRTFGLDLEYSNDTLEFHINTIDEKEYFINIYYNGSEKELLLLLEELSNILIQETSEYELGYYKVNENGDQVSDDIYLKKFLPPESDN